VTDYFSTLASGRDPLGWLAAADMIEESGRPEDFSRSAEEIRREGMFALALLAPMARMAISSNCPERALTVLGLGILLRRTRAQVRVIYWDRRMVWRLPLAPLSALLPDLWTNPPQLIDYDRPTMIQFRYLRKRIAEISRVTLLLTSGGDS